MSLGFQTLGSGNTNPIFLGISSGATDIAEIMITSTIATLPFAINDLALKGGLNAKALLFLGAAAVLGYARKRVAYPQFGVARILNSPLRFPDVFAFV